MCSESYTHITETWKFLIQIREQLVQKHDKIKITFKIGSES